MRQGEFNSDEASEFAVGTVRGVRSWEVDRQGNLLGLYFAERWKPSENQATCYDIVPGPRYIAGRLWPGVDRSYFKSLMDVMEHKAPDTHCCCGFYAYYNGSNDYKPKATVSGVVEGYGKCVIGTKGFRAEKARIVALCLQKPRIQWNMRNPFLVFILLMLLSMSTFSVISIPRAFPGGPDNPSPPVWAILIFTAGVLGISIILLMFSNIIFDEVCRDTYTRSKDRKIRKKYKGIPIYRSFAEMIEKHPPTKDL